MRTVAVAVVSAMLAALASGCQSEGDDVSDRSIEEVAAEARGLMDGLAAAIGPDSEVTQDVITSCVPGDPDSGQDLIYNIRIVTEPGVAELVRGEIADRYRADGWEVRERGSDDVVFRRDNVGMSVAWSDDQRSTVVGGSGGCVR